MDENIYEEFKVLEIVKKDDAYELSEMDKKVISEISLKIIVNNQELASLLCLNQLHIELAIGFLYNEGVINSYDDIKDIYYNDRMFAVIVELVEGIEISRQESLRSVTSGCGKCTTYINPLKQSQYAKAESSIQYPIKIILDKMREFIKGSEVFGVIGGVHSVLFYTPNLSIVNEDIGRHNCIDKITGILLRDRKLDLCANSIVFLSGRISSEIIAKAIRLRVPILVSRSTPTAAAVKLAKEYQITLLGFVRGDKGIVYTCQQRVKTKAAQKES